MFETSPIVGLEIGTSKVVAAVGQLNQAGALNIIGVGQAVSRGVRKGEIFNCGVAEEDIRIAIDEAEKMADVEITSVYLGVSGAHIRSLNNRGVHQVVSTDRSITPEDRDDVLKNAKAINLPPDQALVHDMRQHFVVDGQGQITDPVGMLGKMLCLDVHAVYGDYNRLNYPINIVKKLQLEVDLVAFNGLAASLAMLTNEQKDIGALVLDIGAGTCDFAVYCHGKIKHTGVIALGGDHITNDLVSALKVPSGLAEDLKLQHGSAILDERDKGQTVSIPSSNGTPDKTVNLEHLRKVMSLRVEEMLTLVYRALDKEGMLDYIQAGVVICGGCARIPNIQKLARSIFNHLPVTVDQPSCLTGLHSSINQPEFSTALGLVKFGSLHHRKKTGGFLPKILGRGISNLWRKQA